MGAKMYYLGGGCLAFLGLACLIIGAVLPAVLMTKFDDAVTTLVSIPTERNSDFNNWVYSADQDDAKIHYKFNFYHVENDESIQKGGQIKLTQKGPYTYQIINRKYNVSYRQSPENPSYQLARWFEREWYEFEPDMSGPGLKETDMVTLPNMAYIVLMGQVGSEANLAAIVGPGTLAEVYSQLAPVAGVFGTDFFTVWGDFPPAVAAKVAPVLAANPLQGYISFGQFVRAVAGKPTEYGDFSGMPLITFNKTQATYLLTTATSPIAQGAPVGLLKTTVLPGLNDKGFFLGTTFMGLFSKCKGQGMVSKSTAPTDPCALIFTYLWPKAWDANPSLRNVQAGYLAAFYMQLGQAGMQLTFKGAGGSLFASRSINEWTINKPNEPLLSLVGAKGAGHFLCSDKPPAINDTISPDKCNWGYTEMYTGKDKLQLARKYYSARSMHVLPKQTYNKDGSIKYCSPFLDCENRGLGAFPLKDKKIEGFYPAQYPAGKRDGMDWNDGVKLGDRLLVFSTSLMRQVYLDCKEKATTQGVETLRCFADIETLKKPAVEESNLITGLMDRSIFTGGVPFYLTSNNFIGLTAAESSVYSTAEITSSANAENGLKNCIQGSPGCIATDPYYDNVYADIEPMTGAAMAVHERLTLGYMIPTFADGGYKGMWRHGKLRNATFVPVFAADKFSSIRPTDADKLKMALSTVSKLKSIMISMVVIGAMVFLAGLALILLGRKAKYNEVPTSAPPAAAGSA